ncbi:MAG: uroporphyrinogen-III C-methyltransferase [Peptococcaceae bacterium]|nr:uroporphyrinogen-III C-methyltransferase [Peptococcaceae bacterium]
MTKGYVYLVGAGPGDPKLLTIKGSECIAKADVLVYDRLVSKQLLKYARPECEMIYAGKSPEGHTLTQEEINQLLVRKALEGKVVTRLKGGDPFVFGRGGEEAEALIKARVSFEIVPGITSAVAAPAYAGIPVTHRDFTSSFTVVTGHEKPSKERSAICWEALAKSQSTLVFLMGMENLGFIATKLVEHGLSPTTPAGLIQWGTWPKQRVLTGRLDNIAELARQQGFTNPAVIIVGKVVELRDSLQWLERKPLYGQKIVVTRARHQASELSKALAELGAEPLEFPVIRLAEPTNPELLQQAVAKLSQFSWIIFTSVNGVEAFFTELARQQQDIRELAGMQIAAIGPATQKALEEKGLRVTFVPDEYRAEKIAEGLQAYLKPGQKVLLPRAEEAREILPETLRSWGVEVVVAPAYKTVLGDCDKQELQDLLRSKAITAVTFTSSSTVRNFWHLLDEDKSLLEQVKCFSIGPITTATAEQLGIKIDCEAKEYTIQGLVDALLQGVAE